MSLTSQCHFLKGFYCFSFSFYAIFCPPFVPLRRFLVKTYIDNQWITFYNTFCIGIELGNAQNGTVDLGRFSLDNMESVTLYNGQK